MPYPFSVNTGTETLEGTIYDRANVEPSLLFLHGAGGSDQKRVSYLAKQMITKKISSVSFDFSGHGKSTGKLEESSLQKRYNEVCDVSPFINTEESITLCGTSMGGYLAVKMLSYFHNVHTLLLYCPAIYSKDAFDVPFTDEFSKILQTENSWKNTDIIENMKKFTGNVFIIIGQKDEVIPKGVIDLYMNSFEKAYHKELIIVAHADHQIHKYLQNNKNEQNRIFKKIQKFL